MVLARENPFRVERLHGLGFRFPTADSMYALRARITAQGGRGAIVGPHGSGKTTLMCELAGLLRAEGRQVRSLRLQAGRHSLTTPERLGLMLALGPDDAVLLDGGDELWTHHWWVLERALRPAGMLLITAHRAGRLPTVMRTTTSLALTRELIGELGVAVEDPELSRRFTACRGDVRAVFRELYEASADSRSGVETQLVAERLQADHPLEA